MSILFVLVPLALVLVGAAVAAFLWSVRSGQLDDLVTPAHRMLHDARGRGECSTDDQCADEPRRTVAQVGTDLTRTGEQRKSVSDQ